MPRFTFEISNGRSTATVVDNDIPDRDGAKARACELANVLLREAERTGRYIDQHILRVTDTAGTLVMAMGLKEASAHRQGPSSPSRGSDHGVHVERSILSLLRPSAR